MVRQLDVFAKTVGVYGLKSESSIHMYIFDFFLCEERIILCLKDGKRTNNREKKIRLKERKALYSFVYTSVLKQRILIILQWGLMNMHSFSH